MPTLHFVYAGVLVRVEEKDEDVTYTLPSLNLRTRSLDATLGYIHQLCID